jgi:hypothetical protein
MTYYFGDFALACVTQVGGPIFTLASTFRVKNGALNSNCNSITHRMTFISFSFKPRMRRVSILDLKALNE